MAASYRIITGGGNTGTAVNWRRPAFSPFLNGFDLQREDITDVSLSLDHARCTRIDLQFARQPQDLDINAPIKNIFVNSSGLKQILPRERPLSQEHLLQATARDSDRARRWLRVRV